MYQGEFNLGRNPTENPGLPPIEQALQNVEEHIKNAELNSPRFQAFADCADILYAGMTLRFPSAEEYNHKGISRNMREMRPVLIDEDIRKKKNTVPGYQQEFEKSDLMLAELLDVVGTNTTRKDRDKTMISTIKRLREIKRQTVERKGQQPPLLQTK